MSATFETFQSTKNNQFYFRLKAANGEPILASEGYTTKANCDNGVSSVKTNAHSDTNYLRLTSVNDLYYFNLKASNGQIIGTSQMYASAQGRDHGIHSVQVNAPIAKVVDLTTGVTYS